MSDIGHMYRAVRYGLAPISWLLIEWDMSGRNEAWFSELLRKYNDRQERAIARRLP